MMQISEKMANIIRRLVSEENIEKGIPKLQYNKMRRKLIEYELHDRNLAKKYSSSGNTYSLTYS
jgi:Trm5-related predicted tRNA methylase